MSKITNQAVRDETAEDVYIEQHQTIEMAIETLQRVLNDMRAPGDPDRPITWQDVSTNAHIIDALQRAELA